jgi:ATP synthase proteolipid subunit
VKKGRCFNVFSQPDNTRRCLSKAIAEKENTHNYNQQSIMVSAELLTGLGAASSIFFCSTGAAVASAPAGVFALRSSTWRAFVPIVIAGVLAIYGIIVAVILAANWKVDMTESDGYKQLAAGLSVGLACFGSGLGMVSAVTRRTMHAFMHVDRV